MQLSILLVLSILEATVLGSALPGGHSPPDPLQQRGTGDHSPPNVLLARTPTTTSLKCNADNCYRVMTNTLSVATPFCSTFIQSTTTQTIQPVVTVSGTDTLFPAPIVTTPIPPQSLPTHITSQCELTTAPPLSTRLSSACSCLPTPVVPVTVTATVILPATTVTVNSAPTNCADFTNPIEVTVDGVAETFITICNGVYESDCLLPAEFDGDCSSTNYDFAQCLALCETYSNCVGINYNANLYGEQYCAPLAQVITPYLYDGGDAASGETWQGAYLSTVCLEDAGPQFLANC